MSEPATRVEACARVASSSFDDGDGSTAALRALKSAA